LILLIIFVIITILNFYSHPVYSVKKLEKEYIENVKVMECHAKKFKMKKSLSLSEDVYLPNIELHRKD